MIHRKSVKELERILRYLKSRLAQYDEDAKRDKEKDYKIMPQSELKHILHSGIRPQDKKTLLLSQIGLLRINLFMEFYERIQILEQNSQLDEAVDLMNDYASNIAIPFIPKKKTPSLVGRFMDLFAKERRLEPFEYVQEWKSKYQSWIEGERKVPMIPQLRRKEFSQLRFIYNMLYAVSFSDENFPPSPTIIFFDPTRMRI